jgi:hypothetical protein
MATAPQAAMEMPQQGENPYNDPATMAVYDEMRKTVSPKEFGDEMLASAAQSDPEEVAKFRSALEQIDLPPEALDQLNDMVDEILANPQNYAEIRAKYMEQGATDDILPEQFDAQFFTALNMAIDQMIAAPSGVQAFAKGGIAELTPVSKAIASYGRNGDTMLAHITPAEARMLRRKGGSGTINPKTGLPEFFLKKLFKGVSNALKSIGNAVKDFAKSTVGKIVTTVALGFFLGPAAASFLGATSTAAVAAVSGFVGSAGATMLGGGNLKDSLKAGAMGALTAGATAGVMGAVNGTNAFTAGSYSGAGLTPSEALQSQVDKFSNFVSGAPAAPMADVATSRIHEGAAGSMAAQPNDFAPQAAIDAQAPVTNTAMASPSPAVAPPAAMPTSSVIGGTTVPASPADLATQFPIDNTSLGTVAPPIDASAATTSGNALAPSVNNASPAMASSATGNAIAPSIDPYDPSTATRAAEYGWKPTTETSTWDKAKNFWDKNISPSGIQQEAAGDAIKTVQKTFPTATADQIMKAPPGSALAKAYSSAMPGMLSTYGPATALGIGAIGAVGGFSPGKAPVSPYQGMLTGGPGSARDLMSKDPTRFHVQYLPGVNYYNGSVLKPAGMATGGEVTGSGGINLNIPLNIGGGGEGGGLGGGLGGGGKPAYGGSLNGLFDGMGGIGGGGSPLIGGGFGGGMSDEGGLRKLAEMMQQQQGDYKKNVENEPPLPFAPTFGQMASPFQNVGQFADGGAVTGAARAVGSGRFLAPNTNVSFAQGPRPMFTSPNTGGITALSAPPSAQAMTPLPMAPRATPASQNLPQLPQDTTTQQLLAAAQARALKDYRFAMNDKKAATMNTGGIAGLAQGGYPRRTGQIDGPGTETSDSIPAMLSDGEFVMTAKAVRGAGKGDRRSGAKRMYALMHQLEKNAARG